MEKPKRKPVLELTSETVRLNPTLANKIGLNESILLLQLEFWISITDHEYEGKRWTYQTVDNLQKFFSFWSEKTIRRAINSLKKQKLIYTGNHNKKGYDKTRWFALNLENCNKLDKMTTPYGQNDHTHLDKMTTPIPDTSEDTSLKKVSKDTNVFEKNKYLESNLFKELITTWNNIPLVNKHKFIESKTMDSLWKLYNKLLSGKFIKSCTNISTGWLIQNNIPVKDKKFSHSEIINIIKQVGLQYQEGYWPWTLEDKKRILPKTLLNVFYNPYNPDCPSVFLKVMANPPRKRNEEDPIDIIILKKYKKLFNKISESENTQLTYAVNCVIREQRKIKNTSGKYQTKAKNIIILNNFVNTHIDFLGTFKSLTIGSIKPYSGIWKLFINNIQFEYGVDLYPSTEKLKQLIKVHNKEQTRKENIKKLGKTLDTYV
jgi:hypothetical protein